MPCAVKFLYLWLDGIASEVQFFMFVTLLHKNVTHLWYFGNHICICHYNTGADTERGDNLLVHSSQDAYDESKKAYYQSMFPSIIYYYYY